MIRQSHDVGRFSVIGIGIGAALGAAGGTMAVCVAVGAAFGVGARCHNKADHLH